MKEVKRPWGLFKQFAFNEKCTVKVIVVNPGEELSLQAHKKRNELWYFFDDAVVQLNEHKIHVKSGETIEVKKRMKHRVIAEDNVVRFIEIAKGKFDEKDEIRFEDKYGRK
ncbi:MAG: phosphomannose isomerase type II C-terminal cupin domain [Nanoarchaeota archaeon]